jgi:GNAT superfamily N-acetyltransferase
VQTVKTLTEHNGNDTIAQITLTPIIDASNDDLQKLAKITTNQVLMNKIGAVALITYETLLEYKKQEIADATARKRTISRMYFTWLIKQFDAIIGFIALYKPIFNIIAAIKYFNLATLKLLKSSNNYFMRLVIASAYQHHGIESSVISDIIQMFRKHNIVIISLINSTNDELIKIHPEHKFNHIGTLTFRKALYYAFIFATQKPTSHTKNRCVHPK